MNQNIQFHSRIRNLTASRVADQAYQTIDKAVGDLMNQLGGEEGLSQEEVGIIRKSVQIGRSIPIDFPRISDKYYFRSPAEIISEYEIEKKYNIDKETAITSLSRSYNEYFQKNSGDFRLLFYDV